MPFRRRSVLRASQRFIGLSMVLALAACTADLPQTTLYPKSTNALFIYDLFVPIFWAAVAVFVVVEGLLVYSVLRFRTRGDLKAIPYQLHGNAPLEVAWTIAPAVVLGVIFFLTVQTLNAVESPPKTSGSINVRIIGHQWWWEFQYPELKIVTASDLHIPAGQTVNYTLESVDVIHSFWVPQLGGKTDLVPGHVNKGSFSSARLGEYFGQCAEFCGQQHAQMRFRVFAQSAEDFQAWVRGQQAPPAEPSGLAKEGAEVFARSACVGCHTIAGTKAVGLLGPNLTHFGSRSTIASGMLPNTAENLSKWLHNPEAVKPGNDMSVAMAEMMKTLSEKDLDALVAYLLSLK